MVLCFLIQDGFGQAANQPSQFVSASFFQQDNQQQVTEKSDLQQEFEKLEFRLRELEDDFEKKIKAEAETDGADDEKLEGQVAKLEEKVDEVGESVGKIEGTLPSLVYSGHKKPKMALFGRIHLDQWSFPEAEPGIVALEGENPQDRTVFRRLRLGVGGDLNDNVFYKYEGEFAGGESVQYRDAYIGVSDLPLLRTVIIGNHKRPYGLDHLNSSRHNVFIERPFIIEAFNQDARRLGISSNGFTEDLKYNWRFGAWHEELTQDKFGYVGDHYQMEGAARLAATPWYDEASDGRGYFHWGISGSVGYPDGLAANNAAQYATRPEARSRRRWLDTGQIAGADTNMLLGLETVFNYGPLQFVGEYMRANVDRLDMFGPDLQFHGGYFYVAYFLTGEHMPWDRETGTLERVIPYENFFSVRDCDCNVRRGLGAWQIAARYSYADLNDQNIIGGDGSSFTLGLNWLWNPYTRLQFNYIVGEIEREPLGSGDYQILGMRLMVDF